MRCVVTGGAGFLGSHLCERLMDRGDEVVCVDNFITGSVENLAHVLGRPGFSLLSPGRQHAGRGAGTRSTRSSTWLAWPHRAPICGIPSRR